MSTNASLLGVLLVAAGTVCAAADGPARSDPAPAAGPKLSGPYASGNLAVFLVHGPDRIKGKAFLTLDEALEQKKAVVNETKNVNELSIDNLSADADVFIQAGDIVKGGQQDRVLALDLVVPAGAKKVPLSAFCVEAGRWVGRGGEAAGCFGSSKDCLSLNALKVAAREQASQQGVWSNVEKAQRMLARNTMAEVRDRRSATSLQLTLENKKVTDAIDAAVKELAALPEKAPDVIGCAVAINGTVIGADTYASSALFRKLWPKLLKAAAVEALAERKPGAKVEAPTAEAVRTFLADCEKGKAQERSVSPRVDLLKKEGGKTVVFESLDKANCRAPLRTSYLTKVEAPPPQAPDPLNNSLRPNRR